MLLNALVPIMLSISSGTLSEYVNVPAQDVVDYGHFATINAMYTTPTTSITYYDETEPTFYYNQYVTYEGYLAYNDDFSQYKICISNIAISVDKYDSDMTYIATYGGSNIYDVNVVSLNGLSSFYDTFMYFNFTDDSPSVYRLDIYDDFGGVQLIHREVIDNTLTISYDACVDLRYTIVSNDTSGYWNHTLSNFVNSLGLQNVDTDQFYNQGFDDGYIQGEDFGYSRGYSAGFNDGTSTNATAQTIFNGILNIALVPINFFLAIFNFEILGINMSGAIGALLSICCVIIVLRFIVGGKQTGGDK